ncbi:hypothetical protein P9E34_14155 [Schinkia azotoformans]|uniref:hypothetical protein n=1 Tax=Schinkia azotoformans TaxID=1454 RepID=UPI002DB636B4|nr:hypothetical protein [Schinkia azotoformans]MEC1725857.1 hypothetical protein [Schinkia azotoformans]
MYGNVVSSNGLLEITSIEQEKLITLEKPINFLSLYIGSEVMLYINDDPDGIYCPVYMGTKPFTLEKIPIWKIRIVRYGHSNEENLDGEKQIIYYSYYGFY